MSRTRFILVACALALPVASHAETRGSANYSVTTDTLDAAGGTRSAGTIESVASVGGMGIIAHAAPTQSRSGFPAMLVDPTALAVTASPGSVPEGDATQLTGAFRKFKPQLLIISAGFDAHEADPLGDLGWSSDVYAELTEILRALCREQGHERIVSLLEGGYSQRGITEGVRRHIEALEAPPKKP